MDNYFLFPGTWNYAWAISAFNGNEESELSPLVVAPSPASGVTEGSPGPTCPPPVQWCPFAFSLPPGVSSVPNPTSTTTDGGTIPTSFPVVTVGNCAGDDCINGRCVGELPSLEYDLPSQVQI